MSGVLDTKASDATLVDTTAKNNNNNSSSPLNSNSVTTTSASASEQIGTNYNHNQLSNLLPPHLEIDNITPASTFSASFDPHSNLPNSTESNTVEFTTPPAHPHSHPRATGVGHHPRESTASISTLNLQQAQEQWNQIVAESLAEIALQFEEASRRVGSQPLQLQPQDQDQGRGQGRAVPTDVSIHARLEGIEASQARFVQDLETVRLKLKGLADDNSSKGNGNGDLTTTTTGDTPSWKAKEKMREAFIGVEERFESADSVSVSGRVENLQRRTEGLESRMEVLEKSVEGILETIKLDQARLYSRLHNATVALNKHAIKAPPMANGKPPANFPVTKGEFEHLTKERYEHILKSYNLPVKGDINAKREAVREFIGLTPPGK